MSACICVFSLICRAYMWCWKTKTKMSGLFSLSETWRMKNGRRDKHSRQQRQLWNIGEFSATNLSFRDVLQCTVGSRGGAPLCFRRSENEGKWQQIKLAGRGVLFPRACSNEPALETDGGNWSLVGPKPPPSHLSGVFFTRGNTLAYFQTHYETGLQYCAVASFQVCLHLLSSLELSVRHKETN